MDQHSRSLGRWTFVLSAICIITNTAYGVGLKANFHIAAGSAPKTLQEFYQQSHVRVLYLSDTVRGVQTQEVVGELDASDALDRLLRGTGLTYEYDGKHSAVIKPVPHSSKLASSGEHRLIAAVHDADNDDTLEEILVTGSLIHGVLDITSPLVVVDRREMQKTSFATVQDTVRALPMAASITRGEVFAGTGNINRGSSINLRGLGDSATLVLVNGRRQPMTGTRGDFVDVSNIPWSVVDRIEVLPDGGSALYGSDAIAGVVNIILRQRMEGAETQLRFGTTAGGASETMVAQLAGHEWESGHWLAAYQYSHRTALDATDRSFTANADKRALGGSDFRRTSSNPGNILNPLTLQPMFAIPRGQDGTSLAPDDLLPGVVNYQNQFANFELLPDVHTHNVYFTASQNLSEHFQLFAEGRYGQRDVHQRPWAPDRGPFVVPATNPFYVNPVSGAPFVVVAYDIANDLGPYTYDGRTRNYQGTLGVKATIDNAWQISLSASDGQESLDLKDHGSFDQTALNAALADSNSATAFNPFGEGSHTNPATLAAIETDIHSKAISTIPSIQLQADGPLFYLPSGIAKAALGTEYREETFESDIRGKSSDPLGISHVQLSRAIAAAYTELSVPLIGEANDPHAVPLMELSLAGRYEHYSDFGRTFNPKIGLRWTPLASVKVRTSWGTSFKAPNLVDLDVTHNLTGLASLRDPRSATGRSIIGVVQGGNPDLKEERATTWTVGVDLAPSALPGFQLSLTGYSIDYKDQVIQPGPPNPADILLQEDQWAAVITRNPSQSEIDALCNSAQFLGNPAQCKTTIPTVLIDFRKHNLAITKVTGLDLTLNQAFKTDYGHFNIGVIGSYMFHFKRAFTNTAPAVNSIDTVNNSLALRVRGMLEWQQHGERQSGYGATLTVNYSGSYKDGDSLRNTVGAWTTFDVGLRYRIGGRGDWLDETEWAMNVVNVLNTDPPFVDKEWGYDIVNAPPTGRVISASLSKHW